MNSAKRCNEGFVTADHRSLYDLILSAPLPITFLPVTAR